MIHEMFCEPGACEPFTYSCGWQSTLPQGPRRAIKSFRFCSFKIHSFNNYLLDACMCQVLGYEQKCHPCPWEIYRGKWKLLVATTVSQSTWNWQAERVQRGASQNGEGWLTWKGRGGLGLADEKLWVRGSHMPEAGKGSLQWAEDSSGLQWHKARLDWQPDHTCLTGIITAFGF